MKNRDKKDGGKKAERQTEIAGKLAFHRVDKLKKMMQKLWAKLKK